MNNGWSIISLGEILTERKETPPSENISTGEISIVSKIGFNTGKIELRNDTETKTGMILIKPGDLVISGINAVKGAIAIYKDQAVKPIAATIHYGAYIPNKERVDTTYLWWFLRSASFKEIVQHYIPGGIKTELKSKRLLPVPIPLPPLDEQRRIVARIEALAARVNQALELRKQAVEEADRILDSALMHIFNNDTAPKIALKMVSKYQRGRFSWRPRNDPRFYDGEYPFIQIGDIPRNKKFITSYTQSLNEEGLSVSRIFPAGTIVISIAATIGAVGILGFNSCMPDSLVGFTADSEKAITDYIYYFLKYSQTHFENIAPQSAQKNINIRILDDVKMPIFPLHEQHRIVAYLDSLQARVDALRRLQAESQRELEALLPSILDRAFKGEM